MSEQQSHDRGQIEKAIRDLQQADQDIEALQSRLGGEMALLATSWKGNAATAFTTAHQSFNEKFDKTQVQLQTIIEDLNGSLIAYRTNEDTQQAAAQSIASMVNY